MGEGKGVPQREAYKQTDRVILGNVTHRHISLIFIVIVSGLLNAIDLSADLIAYVCNCLGNPAILSCVGCADKIDQTGLPRQHQRTASII